MTFIKSIVYFSHGSVELLTDEKAEILFLLPKVRYQHEWVIRIPNTLIRYIMSEFCNIFLSYKFMKVHITFSNNRFYHSYNIVCWNQSTAWFLCRVPVMKRRGRFWACSVRSILHSVVKKISVKTRYDDDIDIFYTPNVKPGMMIKLWYFIRPVVDQVWWLKWDILYAQW